MKQNIILLFASLGVTHRFQETATAKIGSALEYLDGYLKQSKGDDKVLLFGHHEKILDGMSTISLYVQFV